MALSERTRAELLAGRAAVAAHEGREPTPIDIEVLETILDRAAALRKWERAGLLRIENKVEYYEDPKNPDTPRSHVKKVHIVQGSNEAFLEEPEALAAGAYPSELLTARIALAIHACAGKETDDG